MPQPTDFDPNLEMNILGEIPQPDGTLPSEAPSRVHALHQSRPSPPNTSGEERITYDMHGGNWLGPAPTSFVPQTDHSSSFDALGADHEAEHAEADGDGRETVDALDRLFGTHATHATHETPEDHEGGQDDAVPSPEQTAQHDSGLEGSDGNKRKRPGTSRVNMLARGAACEFCKRRKLKCSAEVPACATCIKTGRECVYSQKKQRSRVRELEDRLLELERKLDGDEASPAKDVSDAEKVSDPSVGLTFPSAGAVDWGVIEPDLMTLADAAAADTPRAQSWPWDGMDGGAIVTALIGAADEQKGVGEKLVAHLLQLYASSPTTASLHGIVAPNWLLSRLSSTSAPLPHPTLVLALVPFLLPLSPSAALSSISGSKELLARLQLAARGHSAGMSSGELPRMTDLVAASALRASWCLEQARLFEGWSESASTYALAWSANLGSLGHPSASSIHGGNEQSPFDAEARLHALVFRGKLVQPAETREELERQICLFWEVYLLNHVAGIGFSLPPQAIDEEINTPLPSHPANSEHARLTVRDLLAGNANTGSMDTDRCALIKAVCLFAHAIRLVELPVGSSAVDRAARYKPTLQGYMQSMPAATDLRPESKKAQVWQILDASMVFIHLRQEAVAPESSPEALSYLTEVIRSASSVVNAAQVAVNAGDGVMSEVEQATVVVWIALAQVLHKLADRLEKQASSLEHLTQLRDLSRSLVDACKAVGKTSRFAARMALVVD